MTDHEKPNAGPHRWRPGQSGNPRGRPRKGSALTDAIQAKVDTAELVDIALQLARSGEAESTRLQALAWLRDSGYTRPAEKHEHVVGASDDDLDEDLDGLTIDQLRELHDAELEFEDRRRAIVARPVLALGDGGLANRHFEAASSTRNAIDVDLTTPVATPEAP